MGRLDYADWKEASDDLESMADSRPRNRYTPANCPHCEYDRRFPPLEGGGWLQQDNNGPIVPCPVCNDDGKHPRE